MYNIWTCIFSELKTNSGIRHRLYRSRTNGLAAIRETTSRELIADHRHQQKREIRTRKLTVQSLIMMLYKMNFELCYNETNTCYHAFILYRLTFDPEYIGYN